MRSRRRVEKPSSYRRRVRPFCRLAAHALPWALCRAEAAFVSARRGVRPRPRPRRRRDPPAARAPPLPRASSPVSAFDAAAGADSEGGGRVPGKPLRRVPRVPGSDFRPDAHYWRAAAVPGRDDGPPRAYETPVVVEGALAPSECERWCDVLLSSAGGAVVDVQRKARDRGDGEDEGRGRRETTTTTEIYPMALTDALGAMMDSSHADARFAFVEGLLDEFPDLEEMRNRLEEVREGLFRGRGEGDEDKEDANLFDLFPPSVRPTDCVVLAGEGATSTLHRDPFEWTGTSLCLEGTKVWRFIPPPMAAAAAVTGEGAVAGPFKAAAAGEEEERACCDDSNGVAIIDNALEAYRLVSVAWDGGSDEEDHDGEEGEGEGRVQPLPLSAGWQSDLSLFAYRDERVVPSAQALADMEYGDDRSDDKDDDDVRCPKASEEKRRLLDLLAADPGALRPNIPGEEEGGGVPAPWSAVQHPGDMLIIPAHWWHQTYALEPSVAVASQRCGTAGRDGPRVVRHALETATWALADGGKLWGKAMEDELLRRSLKSPSGALDDPQETMMHLFAFLKSLQ